MTRFLPFNPKIQCDCKITKKKKNHKMMKKPNLSNKSLNKSIYFNLKLFVQSQNQFPHKTKKN